MSMHEISGKSEEYVQISGWHPENSNEKNSLEIE